MIKLKLANYRIFYLILGWFFMGVGIIGAFLPLLPTTIFLIMATWAFSKSSQRWYNWLHQHPKFGPVICNWEKHHALSQKTKLIIFASLLVSYSITAFFFGPFSLIAIISGLCLFSVAIYIAHLPLLSAEKLRQIKAEEVI